MKLFTFFLFIATLQLNAKSYSQKINLSGSNITLKQAFRQIEKQTGYSFFINHRLLKAEDPVSFSLQDATIGEAMRALLKGKQLSYVIIDKTVVLKEKPDPVPTTEILLPGHMVEGVVKDSATGEPLAGVTIRVKGTTAGTVTDGSGRFSLEAEDDAVLEISFVGYASRQVSINGRNSMDILLASSAKGLDQLVVIGYGTQKKSDITGSISTINANEIQSVPSPNFLQAIQGMGAGIDVVNNNGASHPSASPVVRIRGERSLEASNSPLIILDGIPFSGNINDINPSDIASLSVLKDASASAIYGSRGANGVLIVTTKGGSIGKPKVSYNTYIGINKSYNKFNMMNADQFTLFKKWSRLNAFPGVYSGIDDPNLLTDGFFDPEELEGIDIGRNTDWQKLVYKTGVVTDHHLGVTGGTENTKYDIAGGFYKESGIYPDQSFSRYSLKATVNQNLGNHVNIGLSSINNFSENSGESFNPMAQALRGSPMASPYDSVGNILIGPIPGSATQAWNPLNNFLPNAESEIRKQISAFNSFFLEAKLFKGFSYRLNAGAGINSYRYGNFFASNTSENRGGLNSANNKNSFSSDYTIENVVSYNRVIGKNKIDFTGLYSFEQSITETNSFNFSDIPADILQYYEPQYGSNLTGDGRFSKWAIISYMGRVNYNYDDRYLATLTIRSDGSSVLAPGNKYHIFPSGAIAWNLKEESFLKETEVIDQLKFRASYGQVGNSAINPYQTLGGLSSNVYNFGSKTTIGSFPSDAPNHNLTWEYTTTLNLGVDFGFLNNRIHGSIELYRQHTNSLLLPQNLPPTSGIKNPILVNVGRTENKGIEISLYAVNADGNGKGSLRWTTNLNVFLNRGKILELSNGIKNDIANEWFVGHPINVFYDYERTGIWQNSPKDSAAAIALNQTVTGSGSVIGTIRVKDLNRDGKINSDDKTILGSPQPSWEGGITNNISYKGFDFSFVLFARIGGMIWSELYGGSYMNTFQGVYNNLDINYWTPQNNETYYPKPNSAQTQTPYHSLLGYFTGTYLKIRSLSLGYNIPESFSRSIGINNLYIYTNTKPPIYLFSPYVDKFNGMSPETNRNISVDTPPTWSIIFGLKVTF